jgi:hypothetical protein
MGFFNEVKDLDHLEEEVEQSEEEIKALEEEALQMSYNLKLANLYRKASKVIDKKQSLSQSSLAFSSEISENNNETERIQNIYIPENELINRYESTSNSTAILSDEIVSDPISMVNQILKRKRIEKQHKKSIKLKFIYNEDDDNFDKN